MDGHVAALMALGAAVAIAFSAHAPFPIGSPDVAALMARFDISTNNEAALYFTPAGQGMVSLDDDNRP